MNVNQQGAGRDRHMAIPRTLTFLTRAGTTGGREVLLLRGAPTKRLWANAYNGIGGHVEAGEDLLAAATRELAEEAGIAGVDLTLRGVVSIDTRTGADPVSPGILVFVFRGEIGDGMPSREPEATREGAPEWIPLDLLADYPVVDDVPTLVTLVLREGPIFYGHYAPSADGSLRMEFR